MPSRTTAGPRSSPVGCRRSSPGFAEVFSGIATLAVVLTGLAIGVGDGAPSVGTLLAFVFLIRLFIDPLTMIGEILNEAQTAVAGWRRVLDVLDREPDVADPGDDGVAMDASELDVRVEGVAFRYPRPGESAREASGFEALRGVDVHLPARSNVAVVGETGSGKDDLREARRAAHGPDVRPGAARRPAAGPHPLRRPSQPRRHGSPGGVALRWHHSQRTSSWGHRASTTRVSGPPSRSRARRLGRAAVGRALDRRR